MRTADREKARQGDSRDYMTGIDSLAFSWAHGDWFERSDLLSKFKLITGTTFMRRHIISSTSVCVNGVNIIKEQHFPPLKKNQEELSKRHHVTLPIISKQRRLIYPSCYMKHSYTCHSFFSTLSPNMTPNNENVSEI